MPSPFPELPLPIRVADLEIAGGIPHLHRCHGYGGVYLLLRRHGYPLGSVTLSVSEDRVHAGAIEAAMHRRLSRQNKSALLLDNHVVVSRDTPGISIVVCTRDRPRSLERCLKSLARLEYPTYEVIVVDNASISEATRQLAHTAGVRYVREERPGLDWARNCGYKAARYDLVMAILDVWLSDDNAVVREKFRAYVATRMSPFLATIIRQGAGEGSMAVDDPDAAAAVVVSLVLGVNELASRLFVAHRAGTASIESIVATFRAYAAALERILGLPRGSLHLVDEDTLRWWFDQPLKEKE